MKQFKFAALALVLGCLSVSMCFADESQSGGIAGFVRNWTGYVPILLVFGVFYFLIIRPQNKKRKILEEMIRNIKSGDQIITHSGIFGSVSDCSPEERHLKIEISKGVKIKVLKSAIALVEGNSKSDFAANS